MTRWTTTLNSTEQEGCLRDDNVAAQQYVSFPWQMNCLRLKRTDPSFGQPAEYRIHPGMGKVGERSLILLDIDRVLSADDLQCVQDAAAERQEEATEPAVQVDEDGLICP